MKDKQVAVPIHFLHLLNAKLARSRLVFSVAWESWTEAEIPNFDFFHLRKNSKTGLKMLQIWKIKHIIHSQSAKCYFLVRIRDVLPQISSQISFISSLVVSHH